MNKLITANVATNLYWFGRYLERIEATIVEIINEFDTIIDVDKDAGKKFFEKLEIDIEYKSASEFLDVAIFGDHISNLGNIMSYARENAIICRANIPTEAFGSVIELSNLFDQNSKSAYELDFKFIDNILSLISEIWGELTQKQDRNSSDYFIRMGKLVEKVDFHLRINQDKSLALIMLDEIDTIVSILTDNNEPRSKVQYGILSQEELINIVNNKINLVVVDR